MHVVISGYYGFDNCGDEAILLSIIQSLRDIQPMISITVLSQDPEKTMNEFQVNAVNRWKFSEIKMILKESDGLISGGGSLLQDETGRRSVPYYTEIINIAKRLKKPVFVYAQGVGPLNKKLSQWITKRTMNKVDRITVRDQESKELLQKIGVHKPVTVAPDPVLGLEVHSFINKFRDKSTYKEPFVTVSVRDWPSNGAYKEKIARVLDQLSLTDGVGIVFVPMHGESDERTSQEVASMMNERSSIISHSASTEEKIALIGQSRLLIGMRLHAIIFAAITFTPFVALTYDPKIDSFVKQLDRTVVGHVAREDWSSQALLDDVRNMFSIDKEERERLMERIDLLREEAKNTSIAALELFGEKKKQIMTE